MFVYLSVLHSKQNSYSLLLKGIDQARNGRGMLRPKMEIISRWISLVPPPKVRIDKVRYKRSSSPSSTIAWECECNVEDWPRISIMSRQASIMNSEPYTFAAEASAISSPPCEMAQACL